MKKRPTHFETNPKAVLEVCEFIGATVQKYHGHSSAATAADIAIIAGTMLLLSGARVPAPELLEEFKVGVCKVIDSFKDGTWLGTAQDAGYPPAGYLPDD